LVLPAAEPWVPAERLRREYEAVGFFLTGHPLDDYATALQRMRVQSWAAFSNAVKSGVNAGRTAATVVSRIERRTKTGNKMGIVGLSDPSGQYEAVIFAEGLQQYRDLLEPGSAVLLLLSAEAQGDDVRARIQSVEPLDQAARNIPTSLRVYVQSHDPLESIMKRLQARGEGEVTLVVPLQTGGEADVKLPGRFKVSPQIAGSLKAVPGVLQVETV
jgi:DNA polymerase-3 subunit alpha